MWTAWLLRSAINDVPICNGSEAGPVTVDRKKVEFFAKKDISNYGPLSWQNMVFFQLW
jgi:hypothetical protein